ncbi:histidine degradation [Candidatus Burkholderia verschuerenii]|uniref:Histidine degradation n=1 Tax=Candidatus Burkholderia verschuerenii TaxID=242163 RepID=A0A0L0MEQ9_9BURK|nr:HutD family protein [Candidatus Burkholderia verschuerenii]KND60459.1 histidine degradation [Candidatus Burkholderia verschuerenii]
MSVASTTLIRGADLVASPWKNGGGVTREIAAYPAGASMDAFAWRVSIAEVAQAGPFSRFAGVDRTLVLLDGAGMRLHEGERTHTLARPLDIAGEASIDATLVDGPTRDFNLMVRRDDARGTLEQWRAPESHDLDADTALLYCAQGAMRVRVNRGEPIALEQGDTLRIEHARAHIDTEGSGALLAIALKDVE